MCGLAGAGVVGAVEPLLAVTVHEARLTKGDVHTDRRR
jgi:hypothetical protein